MSLALNLFVLVVFIFAGIYDYRKHQDENIQIIILAVATLMFLLTVIFYSLTIIMEPGYVSKQPNFLRLLKRLIAENYHLDYVCVPCETLRPENAEHCNYCNRCVQKFDHHCVFVNNCLGYRNHKWFLLFLICYTVYMLGLLTHTFVLIAKFIKLKQHKGNMLKWSLQIFLLFIILLHSPIVIL